MRPRPLLAVFSFLLSALRADLPVPPRVLDPQNAAEAWNIIRLATANVTRLLQEDRLHEVPQQISLCSPALRKLAQTPPADTKQQRILDENTALAFRLVNDTAQASNTGIQATARTSFQRLLATLEALKPVFLPADVRAEISACPVHPEHLSAIPAAACPACGHRMRVRRIPYTNLSPVSETPLLSLHAEATPATLASGVETQVRARLLTTNGSPCDTTRLIPLHGASIRFLLIDPSLQDFHLITPTVTSPAGDLDFTFTPALAGPYRLHAEAAPEETAIPEHPAADLGGEFKVVNRSKQDFLDVLSTTTGGVRLDLSFTSGNGGSPPLRQPSLIRIHVSDSSGQPVTRLEPFMQAFAHLTGFYDDGKTILRLHPVGGDILRDDLRGGPWLAFKIFPPQTGYLRLFCQLRLDGRHITAPLGVHIR